MSDARCQWCRRWVFLDGHWPSCPSLLAVGSNAYVKSPDLYVPGAWSIVGPVLEILEDHGFWLEATVTTPSATRPDRYTFINAKMFISWGDLAPRM